MNTKSMRLSDGRYRMFFRLFIAGAVLFPVLPAYSAVNTDIGSLPETATPAVLPVMVFQALDTQIDVLAPNIGNPQTAAQLLMRAAYSHKPGESIPNNVAAALILKRILTEPDVYSKVQQGLAGNSDPRIRSISAGLRRLETSVARDGISRSVFQHTLMPLDAMLDSSSASARLRASLDALFNGSPIRLIQINEGVEEPSMSVFHPNGLSRYKPNYRFYSLWSDPILKRRAMRFYSIGIMRGNNKLAEGFINYIDALISQQPALEDALIYKRLHQYIADRHFEFDATFQHDDQDRTENRVAQIASVVKEHPKSFLDIGAGDGVIADKLSKQWEVPASRSYAIDVARYSRTQNISWLAYKNGGIIPLADGSVDLALCLMVLHHSEHPELLLKEVYRVLKRGGELIVRETDGAKKEDVLFSAVMDEMFYTVFHQIPDVPAPANYRSMADWRSLFQKVGFSVTVLPSQEGGNPFKPVYFILEKNNLFQKPQRP